MGTIVVYKPNVAGGSAARRAGMLDAGSRLRIALGQGFSGAEEADEIIKGVLDALLASASGCQVLYELRSATPALDPIRYSIDKTPDNRGRYILTNLADSNDKKKLRLEGVLDDKPGKVFRMNVVVPHRANDSSSWSYLSTDINADLNEIEAPAPAPANLKPNEVKDYLISTFMFSRCR